MSELLTTFGVTQYLFSQKIMVQIKDESAPPVPVLHYIKAKDKISGKAVSDFPLLGESYLLDHICSKAGLVQTDRANPVFAANPLYPNIVILSQWNTRNVWICG